jgi:hypothetical protein
VSILARSFRRNKPHSDIVLTPESGTVSINGSLSVSGSVVGDESVETVTAANVITAAESGKTFYLGGGTDYASTLPTAAAGLRFRFVVAAAPTGDTGYTITGTPADKIFGVVASVPVDDAGIAASAADNVIFVNDVALPGDWVEFHSDGTNWYVSGMVSTVEALTANG